MKRRVPQLTDFLAGYSGRDRATVGNTIRKCREAGLLSQGRPGRGAAEGLHHRLRGDRPGVARACGQNGDGI